VWAWRGVSGAEAALALAQRAGYAWAERDTLLLRADALGVLGDPDQTHQDVPTRRCSPPPSNRKPDPPGVDGAWSALDEVDDTTLGELIVEVSCQRDRLDGICHRLVAEHDRRLAWKADGARSEKEWLRDACRLSPGEAAVRTNTARNLDRLPATVEALVDGTVSAGQARVAAQAVRDLPGEARAGLDQLVAQTGADTDTAGLRAVVDDYAHAVAPDSLAERQERAWNTRRLNATRTPDDGGVLEARLDKVGTEIVLTALAPLAAPRGEQDNRTAEQRRADALVELARRSLDSGGLPETGGVRPHVTVVVDLATLLGEQGAPAAQLDRLGVISGETARRLACDAGVCRVLTNGRSRFWTSGGRLGR
jgi:hypothetical protein